jgi:hypothetical protein
MQFSFQDSTNVNLSSNRQAAAAPPPLQPHGQAKPWPLDSAGNAAGAATGGGYNFQRIMDDHFEHYKRPASREQSIDRSNLPQLALAETVSKPPNIPSRGRSGSRQPRGQASASGAVTPADPPQMSSSRNPSRNRTPLALGTSHTDMDLDLRRKELEAKFSQNNGDLNADPGPNADPGLRFRGQPSQEISQLGTIPKRTESLYLKQSLDPKAGKVSFPL